LDRAKEHIGSGHRWVVDVDLEKFFDRVNHDVLMSRLARRYQGQAYPEADSPLFAGGIMEDGIVSPRVEGTPQGSPYLRFFPTSCSMSGTRNWSGVAIASFAMRMTATFMFAVRKLVNGCWQAWNASC